MNKITSRTRIFIICIAAFVVIFAMAAQSFEPSIDGRPSVAQDEQPTPENPVEEPAEPVQLPEIPEGEVENDSGISIGLIVGIIAIVVILLLIGWILGRQTGKTERPHDDEG
jgi:hypothetical protein